MKYSNKVFIGLLIVMASCRTSNNSVINDGFESGSLNKIWSAEKFVPGDLEIQSAVVRSGRKAVKLTLHQGDQIDKEIGSKLERAELKESKKLMSRENSSYSYSFSLFLPADFPLVPDRLVIAQWKQNCSGDCDPNNPVIALRYESGELRVTMQTGPEKTTLYSHPGSILNMWMDFKFQIRFSRNQTGKIKAWMNGKEIIDFNGVTAYAQKYGYPEPGDFYFKTGLYRDTMPQTMSIYIDDYLKQTLSDF